MGILDDAIREHLELKRRLGADDDELKRLEDEAFGPPTRPGEPDFPQADGDGGANGEASEAIAVPGEAPPSPPTAEEEAAEAPTTIAPQEPAASEDTAEEAAEPGGEEGLAEEESPAEAQEPATGEEGAGIYDQTLEDELGLDLELELDQELEELAPLEEEDLVEEPRAPAEAEPPEPEPPAPIESLETVEHPMHEELEEPTDPGADVEPAPSADEPADEGEDEEEDDDVLADTPEFLRDAPEDDELWFEQGEPKDFDFDE